MSSPRPLDLVMALHLRLEEAGIAYCHWKSNDKLFQAVCGETDLDLLFAEDDRGRLATVLAELGFARFETVRHRRYDDIDDWLGIDAATGALVHLQPHFRLTVGPTRAKHFRIPWEHELLAGRVFDGRCSFYRASPVDEALVLLVRTVMKVAGLPSWMFWRRKPNRKELAAVSQELAWLMQGMPRGALHAAAERKFGRDAADALMAVADGPLTDASVRRHGRALEPHLDAFRTRPRWRHVAVAVLNDFVHYAFLAFRRLGLRILPLHRIAVPQGFAVAIVGVDGSGKSTQLKAVAKRLGGKIDVKSVYLGSGKGKSSAIRGPLLMVKRARARSRGKVRRTGPSSPTLARRLWRFGWGATLLVERIRKLATVARAKRRGYVVVCDRFPQAAPGYNDGTILERGRLAEYERRVYASAHERAGLDLIVRLSGDPEALAARRDDTSVEHVREKQDALRAIVYPCEVVEVRADEPQEAVTARILSAIVTRMSRRAAR